MATCTDDEAVARPWRASSLRWCMWRVELLIPSLKLLSNGAQEIRTGIHCVDHGVLATVLVCPCDIVQCTCLAAISNCANVSSTFDSQSEEPTPGKNDVPVRDRKSVV